MTALEQLSTPTLAALGREYMLFGHLLNRAALPHVHIRLGGEAREAVAIEEWMGASPIYTRRMRRCLGFDGDDVGTIFKGFQLDVGFPHQYMDVHYELESPERGRFWLPALRRAARGRAVRRGGRPLDVPRDRGPHLRRQRGGDQSPRTLSPDPPPAAHAVRPYAALPLGGLHRPRRRADRRGGDHPARRHVASRARRVPGAGRRRDAAAATTTAAPSIRTFRLEHLSRAALIRVLREFLVQDHLLVRALMLSVADRADDDVAGQVASAQWIGAGAVAATRLRRALGIDGDGADAIAAVLRVHPAFVPIYAPVGVEVRGERVRLWLEDGDAFHEGDAYGWHALIRDGAHPAFDAMVRAVNPRARCIPAAPSGAQRLAWDVVVDAAALPAEPPPEVGIVAAANTATFVFR